MRLSSCPFQVTRTACALIVIPRSRSSSIVSSTCARMSRAETASVTSRMRSASVDLPWSMCAMIEKLRMRPCSIPLAMVLGRVLRDFAPVSLLALDEGLDLLGWDGPTEEEALAVLAAVVDQEA